MKKILLILSVLLLSTGIAFTQGLTSEQQRMIKDNNESFKQLLSEDIRSQLDTFFTAMINKKYKVGLEKFMLNSPVSKKDDDFANILEQIGKAIKLYGDIKGYEIVSVSKAGVSLTRVNLLGLHQKYPTRWEVTFYRSPELGLIVTNFRFDDVSEGYLK